MRQDTTASAARPSVVRIVLALACLALSALPAGAAVVTVGSDMGNCDYTNLAFAIVFSDPGSTLHVEAKTWTHITDVNFNLFDKSLTIIGGYDAGCTNTKQILDRTVLQGFGTGPVLEIRSTNPAEVWLEDLEIRGALPGADGGGGISISGDVDVTLAGTHVVDNQAPSGGGIFVDGTDGASLTIGDFSVIQNNTATGDGGGILCDFGATVSFENEVQVDDNQAQNGGGIYLGDCSVTMTGPSGLGKGLRFNANIASDHGGGIYMGNDATLSADGGPRSLLVLSNNEAYTGGGIALSGFDAMGHLTRVRVQTNKAPIAAGLYVSIGSLSIDAPIDGCDLLPCNEIRANHLEDGTTSGGAFMAFAGSLTIQSAQIRQHYATEAIGRVEGGGSAMLEGVLISENESVNPGSAGIQTTFGTTTLRGVTMADQIGMDRLFAGAGQVDIDSFIAVGSYTELFRSDVDWDMDCALLETAPTGGPHPWVSNVQVGVDPGFVDRAGGDYHLLPSSPARDLCGNFALLVDLDAEGRPQGLGVDAGADEISSHIFSDGFESGDTTAW